MSKITHTKTHYFNDNMSYMQFLTLRKSVRAHSVALQKPKVSDSRQKCECRAFLRLARNKRTDFRGLRNEVSDDSKEHLGFNPEFFR